MLILRRTFLPPGRLRFASWQPEEANSLVIGGSSPWRRGTISTWSWKPTLSLTAETEDPFSSLLCPAILTIASQQTRNQVLSSGHGWAMMTGKKREDDLDLVVEAHIEFDGRNGGSFQFIAVSGDIDYRVSTDEESSVIERSEERRVGKECRSRWS